MNHWNFPRKLEKFPFSSAILGNFPRKLENIPIFLCRDQFLPIGTWPGLLARIQSLHLLNASCHKEPTKTWMPIEPERTGAWTRRKSNLDRVVCRLGGQDGACWWRQMVAEEHVEDFRPEKHWRVGWMGKVYKFRQNLPYESLSSTSEGDTGISSQHPYWIHFPCQSDAYDVEKRGIVVATSVIPMPIADVQRFYNNFTYRFHIVEVGQQAAIGWRFKTEQTFRNSLTEI